MSEELEHSELGTQEYWDTLYKTEVSNFRSHGDVGEVWFGEDIAEKVVHWMERNVPKSSSVLDIGCGNGMLLVDLARTGFSSLTGMDYSEDAITLAREVAARFETDIKFSLGDILKEGFEQQEFDVVLDKGTYDAISLSSEAKSNRASYIDGIRSFLKSGGLLVMTSCNWTKEELADQFAGAFSVADVIPTPQFRFGGKVGNVVTSVIFKKQ